MKPRLIARSSRATDATQASMATTASVSHMPVPHVVEMTAFVAPSADSPPAAAPNIAALIAGPSVAGSTLRAFQRRCQTMKTGEARAVQESLTHPSAALMSDPARFRQVQNEVVENCFLFYFYPELCHCLS